jgi:predicted deacylase
MLRFPGNAIPLATLALLLGVAHPSFGQLISPKRQVVEIEITSPEDFDRILRLSGELPGFEIWSDHHGDRTIHALVRSSDRSRLRGLITRTSIEDWDHYRANLRVQGADFFDSYHTYDEYIAYIENLASEFPDLAQIIEFGESVQGRIIKGIRICSTPASMPAVFYHGVQHGNELTNGPVLVFLADHLLRNYDSSDSVRFLVDSVEWFILPVSNPDGHEAGTRYNAAGIDLNRDWGTFALTGGFTQPETIAVRNFLLAHPNVLWHVDFHTGVQMILWPWAKNGSECWDDATFDTIADDFAATTAGYSTRGPIYATLYQAFGIATDYAYGDLGLLSYTVEVSSAYAASPTSLPIYEQRMRQLAMQLAEWLTDCDADGFTNDPLLCLRGFSNVPALMNCLEYAGPGQPGQAGCPTYDWANDGDVDLQDAARWLARFQPAP